MGGEVIGHRPQEEPLLSHGEEAGIEEAVVAYFAYRMLDHLPLPRYDNAYDVEDIARMAILWTNLPTEVVADYVPQIRGLMSVLYGQLSHED